MGNKMGPIMLRPHARDIVTLLGSRVSEEGILNDLHRFVNGYRIGLEEARRAVLVLHGIPPGLTGPSSHRYTWQSDLGAYTSC